MDVTAHTSVERSATRKVAVRLLPFVALMFFANYLGADTPTAAPLIFDETASDR